MRVALVVGLAVVTLALTVHSVWAGIAGIGGYLSSAGDCDQGKDPLNLLWKENGTLSNTLSEFADHVGWTHEDGATLYFLERYSTCTTQDAQKASASQWWPTRSHARFEYGDYDDYLGYWTAGASHVDHACPVHVAEDFNGIRDHIADQFSSGGHSVDYVWYGFTEPRMGCISPQYPDGYWAEIAIP